VEKLVCFDAGVPSPTAVYSDVANQISEEAAEGLKAWTAESGQVVKDVAERLLTTQSELCRISARGTCGASENPQKH